MEPEPQSSWWKWVAGAGALLVLVALAYLLLAPAKQTPPAVPVTLPESGASGNGAPGNSGAGMSVSGAGGAVAVSDFLKSPTTAPDAQNAGVYYLAGSSCAPDAMYAWCPRGADTGGKFNITYNKNDQSFIVVLLAEPLGAERQVAEQFLEQALGVQATQLCGLDARVETTNSVNEQYAGKNLGFSFCPGATPLPQ
ncbi:MAG: hypothetical protein KGI78_01125 [Patescibacteria group bacterium]|nr:hypothetical protein [Patescibacteria group bacterium]MDE1944916.1 hypothetical protein [Patescibacteria group bacterium]MDE2057437.1 hypothetical protein [Patescibacteria group bacterium]